jgi:hypothetical protein
MNARKSRIETLEGELKLFDLISLWLSQLQQFESPTEYIESAVHDGESGSVEYQFIKQASSRRKAARDGAPGKSVDVGVLRSLKRLLFFKTLVLAANSECETVIANCRSRLEPARQNVRMLNFFRGSDAWARPYVKENFTSGPSAGYGNIPNGGGNFFVAKVDEMISDILSDLRAAELALASISERFFQRRTIILQWIARAMNETRQDAKSCAEELVKTEPDQRASSQHLESVAQDKSEVIVRKLVDYAQAFALLRFDEKGQAEKLVKPHLPGSSVAKGGTEV